MGRGQQNSSKKILVVTPRFPLPATGACEKDRYFNLLQLKAMGHQVEVLTKVHPSYDKVAVANFEQSEGIRVITQPYVFMGTRGMGFWLGHLLPWNWDGAAYEYAHKATRQALEEALDTFQPDLVWFDYTYLWPLYKQVRKRGVPIITRSINFEARHFLQEDGYTLINLVRFIPKFISELVTIRLSDWIFAITPDEAKIYKSWGGEGKTSTLPLRGLSKVLGKQVPVKAGRAVLKVFFMGSTYNVHHNRAALEFIIKEIAPLVWKEARDKFVFYILGKQIPADLDKYITNNVQYVGYQDPVTYLQDMDIALVPSLFGAGMQQKVFEPMALGLPLVTSKRAIAGYPFIAGEHYLASRALNEFVEQIMLLTDEGLRQKLANAGHRRSQELFAQDKVDRIVSSVIDSLIK